MRTSAYVGVSKCLNVASGIPPSCWFNEITRSFSRASVHPQVRLGPWYTLCVHAWGQAHLFCRGSVLTGCNLQMLRPVGFIGTPLPSHYATLCPPLFSPPPASPRRLSGYVPRRSAPCRSSPFVFSPSNPSAALVRRSWLSSIDLHLIEIRNKREHAQASESLSSSGRTREEIRSGIFSRATSDAPSRRWSIVRLAFLSP